MGATVLSVVLSLALISVSPKTYAAPTKADVSSTPNSPSASTKPTHVVIATSNVFDTPSSSSAIIKQLPPGTQVTLIETASGWTVIARDGQTLGYVEAKQLAPLQ
jgi:uncharacterized protein YgiM (DUF1202 family)